MPYIGASPDTTIDQKDLNGQKLILDADADTSITADTDDQIDIEVAGSDEIKITAAMIAPATGNGSALGGTSNEWADLYLSDGGIIYLGADQDVTLTHVADTGILLNSTMAIQFNDSSQYINAPSATVLDINATDEIELNATLADINANLDVSGTYTGGGLMTTGGNIVIPNAGNIGSASDTDAIAIASTGAVTFSKQVKWAKGGDLASGTSLTIDTDGNYFDVTGTTTITSFSTIGTGTIIKLHFDGALILTHHATDLILPGAANITTAAGDEAEFVEYASADWRCTSYTKVTGAAVTAPATDNLILNSTDGSADAGDDMILDGTDGSATNAGDAILYEDATGDPNLNPVTPLNIRQVKVFTDFAEYSTTSTSFVDATGRSVSFTPTASDSILHITYSDGMGGELSTSNGIVELGISRGAYSAGILLSECTMTRNSNGNSNYHFRYAGFLEAWDAPATTSAVTYNIYIKADSSTTARLGEGAFTRTGTASGTNKGNYIIVTEYSPDVATMPAYLD